MNIKISISNVFRKFEKLLIRYKTKEIKSTIVYHNILKKFDIEKYYFMAYYMFYVDLKISPRDFLKNYCYFNKLKNDDVYKIEKLLNKGELFVVKNHKIGNTPFTKYLMIYKELHSLKINEQEKIQFTKNLIMLCAMAFMSTKTKLEKKYKQIELELLKFEWPLDDEYFFRYIKWRHRFGKLKSKPPVIFPYWIVEVDDCDITSKYLYNDIKNILSYFKKNNVKKIKKKE